jgi:hypothetical protein
LCEEWPNLKLIEDTSGHDILAHCNVHGMLGAAYHQIQFTRQNIVSTWPPARTQFVFSLPPIWSPHEPGYMPLYCAAHWIAARGGTLDVEASHQPVWERSYSELLARIASGDVSIAGLRNGTRENLEAHLFASIRTHYPFADVCFDLIVSKEMYLESYPYLDDEHWRGGMDDSLQGVSGAVWSQLMVRNADVAKWWPFGRVATPQTHSNRAGRPTMMHLIEAEYDARRSRGEAAGRIGQVSRDLHSWAKSTHRDFRAPTAGAIANVLRARHRNAMK